MFKILLSFFIIFTDQLLKYLLVNGFINEMYYRNFGAGFGILKNEILVLNVSMILSFVLLIYLYKNISSYYYKLGIVFMFAGGISNFIDRVRLNFIIDYLNVYNLTYINLADIFIFTGFILILTNILIDIKMKGFDEIG